MSELSDLDKKFCGISCVMDDMNDRLAIVFDNNPSEYEKRLILAFLMSKTAELIEEFGEDWKFWGKK